MVCHCDVRCHTEGSCQRLSTLLAHPTQRQHLWKPYSNTHCFKRFARDLFIFQTTCYAPGLAKPSSRDKGKGSKLKLTQLFKTEHIHPLSYEQTGSTTSSLLEILTLASLRILRQWPYEKNECDLQQSQHLPCLQVTPKLPRIFYSICHSHSYK